MIFIACAIEISCSPFVPRVKIRPRADSSACNIRLSRLSTWTFSLDGVSVDLLTSSWKAVNVESSRVVNSMKRDALALYTAILLYLLLGQAASFADTAFY